VLEALLAVLLSGQGSEVVEAQGPAEPGSLAKRLRAELVRGIDAGTG